MDLFEDCVSDSFTFHYIRMAFSLKKQPDGWLQESDTHHSFKTLKLHPSHETKATTPHEMSVAQQDVNIKRFLVAIMQMGARR